MTPIFTEVLMDHHLCDQARVEEGQGDDDGHRANSQEDLSLPGRDVSIETEPQREDTADEHQECHGTDEVTGPVPEVAQKHDSP